MNSSLRFFFYSLLKYPVKLLVRCKIVPDAVEESIDLDTTQPTFYVVKTQSASELLALQIACKKSNLPDPLEQVEIGGKLFSRTFCLQKPTSLLPWKKERKTKAIELGFDVLKQHQIDEKLDAQLIPVNLTWGRTPTKEKNNANVGTILADQESPTWLRKFFIVLFLGRNMLVRFSDPMSFKHMAEKHGTDQAAAQKLMRIARFHFYRQTVAATGPRLMHRNQMFSALFANPSIKKLIADEAKSKGISEEKAKKQALKIMDEIAGDYRDSMVRVGERILHRLWNRLYNGIEINNSKVLNELSQEGHEIIYVPCHRSHMDYLLLTYVIYHQGLVTPRIAAGINLSFWPAGPIFRKAGAFFIRRSFRGNRMYSTIFREYLGLLFERGYSVKYYTEGGRSRTGRLLAPKTGMLAMTIQSLLRGIDRPLTLVPVYLGYEHVMEVGTYHKELSGSQKKNESIFGVFKAIKNLRNYGKGYVNFGEPININQYLNQNVPEWKQDIDPIDPQKPSWLTPSVNKLADQVMTNINESVALNAVSLVALILHATENKALPKAELESQLDFFIKLQKEAPYSEQLTLPEESGKELLEHVITLNKATINNDSFGSFISLSESTALEMRYYRNNIIHAYMVPALVCRILQKNARIDEESLIKQVQRIISLLKTDLFLWQSDTQVKSQVQQVLASLVDGDFVVKSEQEYSLADNCQSKANINAMAEVADETMQRLTIISLLLPRLAPISKSEFEEKVVSIAKRLSVLNNLNAPEFIDKKAQATLINAMKEHGYIDVNEKGQYIASETLNDIKSIATNLVDIEVLQSIAR